MEVLIDTMKLEEVAVAGENLEEILSDIMTSHIPSDRTISQVMIDGQTYSEATPRAAVGVSRFDINTLEIKTIPTTELAAAMLNTGPGHLQTLRQACLKIAEQFRIEDEAQANEQYFYFLQALQDFFTFLSQALDALAINLIQLESKELSAPAKLRELTNVLGEMSLRQEEMDWILLADMIEYELEPILGDWQRILTEAKLTTH